jgi:hypothetical protein
VTLARVGTPTPAVDIEAASGTITRTDVVLGSGLIVYVISDTAIASLTDNGGAALTALKSQTCNDGPQFSGAIYFIPNAAAGTHALTLTLTAAGSAAIWIDEWSGLYSATLDKSNGDGNYSATHGAGSVGPLTQAVELVCLLAQNVHSAFGATTLPTQGGTWSQVLTGFTGPSGFNSATLVTSATTAITPVFTGDASNYEQANVIVTLIPGTAPSPATLSSPTESAGSETAGGATVGATTDTASGTLYAVGYTGSAPSATQIAAGTDASGNTNVPHGALAVTSTGAKSVVMTGGQTSTTYHYALAQVNAGGNSNVVAGAGTFTTLPPAPTITGVSSSTPVDGASLTITGTAFGAAQSTGSVTLGGTALTVTAWSDTSITVTIALGLNKYGAALNLIVSSAGGGASAPFGITSIAAPSGWSTVDVGTPYATASQRLTASPVDIASGDQIEYENPGGLVTVFSDATFSADSSVSSFRFRVWTSGSGYGALGTATLVTTPTGTIIVISW